MRFLALLAFLFAPLLSATALNYETFTLENGLKVVIVPDHRSPVVVHSVWYRAGSADEPSWRKNKTGIAHMLEHMMFKGTDKIPAGEFSKIVARNGGRDNAFTSYDYTAYYQKVAADRLDLMMEMESDRMANLNINDEIFQPERDVVIEERRWRVDSKPKNRFYEELMATHFKVNTYKNPVIGWRKDIDGYTVKDAIDWYKDHYTPTGAIMILVGDVTKDKVEKMVRKHYGPLAERKIPEPVIPTEPLFDAPRELKKVDAEVKVPVFYRLYRAPSMFAGLAGDAETIKDTVALSVLADVLGGGTTSRLYTQLVKELKIADAASASFDAIGRAESSIDMFIQPKPDKTLNEVEAAAIKEIKKLKTKKISHDELERTQAKMLASVVYAQDDGFNVAYRLGRWLIAGGTPENLEDWQQVLKNLTPADVQRAAQKYLVIKQSTTGLLVNNNEQF